jgi:beta-glucosidase
MTLEVEDSPMRTSEAIERLLGELTLTEKCTMLSGADIWRVPGCLRLGIPSWRTSDGPVGVRGRETTLPGLVIPGPSALAATWDTPLVERLGGALGEEALDRDVDLLLAPTVNLHRSPRGGRHFECFSEDPELTARMAVAYITGVQSRGVGACIKHFIANDQEHERMTIEALVDERTLREVYLRPFEAGVHEASVRSVMASYNFVNGHHATAQPDLLQGVLKNEWGFDGVVVSDWVSTKETVAPALHGLDVEMPGPGRNWGAGQLEAAVAAGDVPESLIDDKVRRILHFLAWRGRLTGEDSEVPERSVDHPEHRRLARQAAAAGMVLLRNDGILPLTPGASIALIGAAAADTALLGGGSAQLTPHPGRKVLEALTERWGGLVRHEPGVDMRRRAPALPDSWIDGPVRVEVHRGHGFGDEPLSVEERTGASQVWFGPTYPAGDGPFSVRLRFTLKPIESGAFRVSAGGFGMVRLHVDGQFVVDNRADSFPASMGVEAGATELTLEAGRGYDVTFEHLPDRDDHQAIITELGLAPIAGDAETRLAAAEQAAAEADVAVVVVGTNEEWETEGKDRAHLSLPAGQDELVRRVIAANPRTVVVLNCGAPVLLPWLDDVAGAVLAWYPGQEGGDAIVDVLTGEAEPGGRMPTTWAREERDTPSYLHYPGEAGVVRYGEELYVGHRWYDARGITPLVPFGHGGSYTTFTWGAASVNGAGTDLVVEVPVTNTGDRSGSDVVQLYVEAQAPPVKRPVRQLAGFAKVHLEPGQTAQARIVLSERSFARWDVSTSGWVVDPGSYDLHVAASAVQLRERLTCTIEGTP